jgi:hypothetical protein
MSSIGYIYEEELSQQTVTGTTSFTSITSTKTLTSGNKYAVFVNSQFGGNDTNFLFSIRVRANGVTLQGSTRVREMNSSVHEQSYSYMTVFTSDGSPVSIEIQTQDGSKTARVEASTILCLDISDLSEGSDYIYNEDVRTLYNTDTYSSVNSLSIPTNYQNEGNWLVTAHVEKDVNDISFNSYTRIKLKEAISGVTPEMSQEGEDIAEIASEYIQGVVTIPSPAQYLAAFAAVPPSVVSLETRDEYNVSVNNQYASSRMFALNLDVFNYYKTATDENLIKVTSPGNFEEVLSIEGFEPPGSQVTILFAYSSFVAGSIDKNLHIDITVDGLESLPGFGANVMHRSYDADDQLPTSFASLESTLPSSSVDIVLRMKGYNTSSGVAHTSLCALSISLSEEDEKSVKLEPSKVFRGW